MIRKRLDFLPFRDGSCFEAHLQLDFGNRTISFALETQIDIAEKWIG
jgi:hypothetical protein